MRQVTPARRDSDKLGEIMSAHDQISANGGTARAATLARNLIESLDRPTGFRDGGRIGLMFVHVSGDEFAPQRSGWVEAVLGTLLALEEESQRRVSSGLAEARRLLEGRPPGRRTLAAFSLWEDMVARLPMPLQYLARVGQEI